MCMKFNYGMRYIVTVGYLQHVQCWLLFTLNSQQDEASPACLTGKSSWSDMVTRSRVDMKFTWVWACKYFQKQSIMVRHAILKIIQTLVIQPSISDFAVWIFPKRLGWEYQKRQVGYVKQRRLNGYTCLNCYWATKNKNRIHSVSWALKDFCIHIQKSKSNLYLKLYSINKLVKTNEATICVE